MIFRDVIVYTQYSAYELNRRPKKKSSPPVQLQVQENLSDCNSSSGSFFLHDPSTLSYNRLSDLFPSGQTVCSDDSGVGIPSPSKSNSNSSVISRPKQRPPGK